MKNTTTEILHTQENTEVDSGIDISKTKVEVSDILNMRKSPEMSQKKVEMSLLQEVARILNMSSKEKTRIEEAIRRDYKEGALAYS